MKNKEMEIAYLEGQNELLKEILEQLLNITLIPKLTFDAEK